MKGVFIELGSGLPERFVNDETFKYEFNITGLGALNVTRIDKVKGVVDDWALFAPGAWTRCGYDDGQTDDSENFAR